MRRLALALAIMVLSSGCAVTALLAKEAPVTVSGSGTSHSAPFTLAGGGYRVDWQLTDTPASSLQCGHGARLASTADDRQSYPLGAGNVPPGEPTATGTTYAYSVPAGSYFIDVLANCDWSFTLTQQS